MEIKKKENAYRLNAFSVRLCRWMISRLPDGKCKEDLRITLLKMLKESEKYMFSNILGNLAYSNTF